MKRTILLVSLGLAFVVPAVAQAQPPTRAHVRQYRHDFAQVRDRFGKRTAACKLVGPRKTCHGKTTDAAVVKSLGILDRMLHPIKLVTYTPTVVYPNQGGPPSSAGYPYQSQPATPTISYTASDGSCGGDTPYSSPSGQCWAIPYSIVQCESGGQNVPNSTGSGANGYYQLMSGGTGSKAQQDAAAHALWAGGNGASNWVCKG